MSNSKIRFSDKYLPDQAEHNYLYSGKNYTENLYNVICESSGILNPDIDFDLDKTDKFAIEEMASNPISLRFLQFLIQVAGVKRVLEIGAFIGVWPYILPKLFQKMGKLLRLKNSIILRKLQKETLKKMDYQIELN